MKSMRVGLSDMEKRAIEFDGSDLDKSVPIH